MSSGTASTQHPLLPPILRMPPETIETIADYVWQTPWQAEGREGDAAGSDAGASLELSDRLALRLVCRDLTSRSLQSFGKAFFTDLTTVITEEALQRLVDIKRHPGLCSFPKTLCIGPHRLLSSSEAGRRALYVKRKVFVLDGVREILAIFDNDGILDRQAHSDWTLRVATQYMNALNRQRLLELKGADVEMLAEAMGGFPRLTDLQVGQVKDHAYWGSEQLFHDSNFANPSILLATGYSKDAISHMTRAMSKVIAAVVAARRTTSSFDITRRLNPTKQFKLTRIVCDNYVELPEPYVEFPLQVQLNRLKFPKDCELWYQTTAELTSIRLNLHGYTNAYMHSPEDHVGSRDCMSRLLGGDALECIEIKYENMHCIQDEISTPGLISYLANRQPFGALKTFTLAACADYILPDLARFLHNHCAELEHLDLSWEETQSQNWHYVWRALSRCEKLERLRLSAEDADWDDFDFEWTSKESVITAVGHLLNGCSLLDLQAIEMPELTQAEALSQATFGPYNKHHEDALNLLWADYGVSEPHDATTDIDADIKQKPALFSHSTTPVSQLLNPLASPFVGLQSSAQPFGSGQSLVASQTQTFGTTTVSKDAPSSQDDSEVAL